MQIMSIAKFDNLTARHALQSLRQLVHVWTVVVLLAIVPYELKILEARVDCRIYARKQIVFQRSEVHRMFYNIRVVF